MAPEWLNQLPQLELNKVLQVLAIGVCCDDVLKRLRKILDLPFFDDLLFPGFPDRPGVRQEKADGLRAAAESGRNVEELKSLLASFQGNEKGKGPRFVVDREEIKLVLLLILLLAGARRLVQSLRYRDCNGEAVLTRMK